jgi:hypothetical protein
MPGIYIEHRKLQGNASLSRDIARHMRTCLMPGKIVVIADDPRSLTASVCKQWKKVTQQVQRERSKTLNAARIAEISNRIALMQSLQFNIKPPVNNAKIGIYFVTLSQLPQYP